MQSPLGVLGLLHRDAKSGGLSTLNAQNRGKLIFYAKCGSANSVIIHRFSLSEFAQRFPSQLSYTKQIC
jgi:hypothetical protein